MGTRYVALLKGVNVGRANRVSMDALRSLVSSLGYRDPRTILNSGNVVFSAPDRPSGDIAARIEAALDAQAGISVPVVILSDQKLSAAVAGNPLVEAGRDPSRLLVAFLLDPADGARLRPLVGQDWHREEVALGSVCAYAWCPDGVTGSPVLARRIDHHPQLGDRAEASGTARAPRVTGLARRWDPAPRSAEPDSRIDDLSRRPAASIASAPCRSPGCRHDDHGAVRHRLSGVRRRLDGLAEARSHGE
jgi:uncharacterized protein (DUF1697 family)